MRILLMIAALAAAPVAAESTTEFQSVAHLFDYDAKQPLDVHDKIIEEFTDGTLHDITYTSPKGGPVAAYLVVPKGKGPFAAVLFGHWGNGTRAEFIPEAKIYAKAEVQFYDTGHDLNDPQALEDRYDWLVKHINLRREPILTKTP